MRFDIAMKTNGCIKVRLTFQSPLGGKIKRKHLLTFLCDNSLHEVAKVVSGEAGAKPLWPTSFGEWLQSSDASLLVCHWNETQWEPLPLFSVLKDINFGDETVELLFGVLNLSDSGRTTRTASNQTTVDVPPMVKKPPLIPLMAKAKAKVSTSGGSTRVSDGDIIRL